MPLYEYECRKCKAHTEILQKITDKPLVKCRKCGGRLEKQWSSTSFQLKGSGWYVTDYAGKKTEAVEEKKSAEDKKGAAAETTSAKTDDKTPAKEKSSVKKTTASKPAPSSSE